MEKIKLNPDTLAFCQGMIFEDGELRPLPVPQPQAAPHDIIDDECALPEIEFGMQKAGTLAIADRFEVPARLAPTADAGTTGASATHPATETETLDALNASRAIMAAYDRAVAQQVEGKGLFCKPFFVRYAWRYADGRHSLPSAPVLMLPAVLPPCLAVLGNEAADDKRVLSFSPSSCRFFALRCRVLSAGQPGAGVVALDFFITPPVSTHDPSATLPRGVLRWASAAAFVGHFSESGDEYADHTAESVGLGSARAWHFPPNARLESELLQSAEFYRVASLPISTVGASAAFADVPVSAATDAASVKACQRLAAPADCGSPLDCSLAVVASARLSLGARVLTAGSQLRLPSPQPLRTLAAASGSPGDAPLANTEVTVWAKRGGQIRRVTKSFEGGPAVSWHGAFPRYIHYPCPGAFRMRIKQGTRTWTLPLTPTADGRAACWWGGLDATAAEPSSTTGITSLPADNGTAAPFECGCVVAVSHIGNERVRETLCHCGEAAPLAIAAEPGQSGAVVLTAQGAWRLAKSAGKYVGSRLATADPCLPGYAACAIPGAIAYATAHGIALLSGATPRIIRMPDAAPALPYLPLLNPAIPPALATDGDSNNGRALHYDGRRLYACDAAGRWMAYSPSSSAVAIPSATALVITRPFPRLDGKRLTAIAVGKRANLLLWGSHDGVAWKLVGSSTTGAIRPLCGTPYAWYAAAISSPTLPASLPTLSLAWQ